MVVWAFQKPFINLSVNNENSTNLSTTFYYFRAVERLMAKPLTSSFYLRVVSISETEKKEAIVNRNRTSLETVCV